jgi:MarR family transcriptional regulator, transcriptional regulator for hemolysin
MEHNEIIDLDDILMYQLYRSGRLLRFRLQQLVDANEPKSSPEQFFLLYKLYIKDGQSQKQLADKILNDHPNITRLIDKLEEIGYVYREVDKKDRRTFKIYISEKGKSRFKDILPLIMLEREKLLKGINEEDEKLVKGILGKMETNIKENSF